MRFAIGVLGLLLVLGSACRSQLARALPEVRTKDEMTRLMGSLPRCQPRAAGGEDCEWRRRRLQGCVTIVVCGVAESGETHNCSWHAE